MAKRKKIVKWRHKATVKFFKPFFHLYAKLKYGYTFKKCKKVRNRPCLVLYNHQTGFDQFFVALAFYQNLYFVATEDIASLGILSRLLRFFISPIFFKKSTQDMRAVKECLMFAKDKASIAIAPEGNRTYSGQTEEIKPSIAKLAKMLDYPLVFFQIRGGYGVNPRWSNVVRKGKMVGEVVDIVEPAAYKNLSSEELYELIKEKLYVNESTPTSEYKSPHQAEYLERVLYICPHCGLTKFTSHKDKFKCETCEMELTYNTHLQFEGVNPPFPHVLAWYQYQKEYLSKLDLKSFNHQVIFQDTVKFSEVIVYLKKNVIFKGGTIYMYQDHYLVKLGDTEFNFNFDEVSATSVLGKNKMNIYFGDQIYQIKGDVHFNAMKYVNLYYLYHNEKKGVAHDCKQFLGL